VALHWMRDMKQVRPFVQLLYAPLPLRNRNTHGIHSTHPVVVEWSVVCDITFDHIHCEDASPCVTRCTNSLRAACSL
jgi:hypothetical protein